MRKAQYTKPDRPLLVTVPEFQGYVGLGRKTAQRIHAKDVVGGSSPSLTLYGDVVQREHSSSVKKNVMLVA